MFDRFLKGKVALITGAANGIGAEVANSYAKLGARLMLADMDYQGLEKVASKIGPNVDVKLTQCDIGKREECTKLVEETLAWKGQLDVFVNCAALYRRVPNDCVEPAHFNEMVNVNMAGPFFLAQSCCEQMKKQRSGKLIFLSSIAASRGGVNGSTIYAMTKAAVTSLTKSLAREMAPWGVHVNAIAPGGVDTQMLHREMSEEALESFVADIPFARLATPQEIANVCCFIASDAASYITGQTLDVNGGQLMR